jgi:hypothetical protein
MSSYDQLIEGKTTTAIETQIIDFIVDLKSKGYTYGTQRAFLNAICHFYDINDVYLNRKKINRFVSDNDSIVSEEITQTVEDKPYTHQQIQKLLDFSDIRTKVIILVMASAGLRLGALPLLRVGHLIPMENSHQY